MTRLDSLMKLHTDDPGDADVRYMIAHEHAKAGKHAEAVEWFTRCLDADPDYHYAAFHMARSLEAVGDIAAAMGVLTTGLARAKAAGDSKASGEIAGYLDTLTG
jgi:thioredoxin-like negative regulator of GroEL